MATVSASFTGTTSGDRIVVKKGDQIDYSVSGTFVATVVLEYTKDFLNYHEVLRFKAAASGSITVGQSDLSHYRFRCVAFTSGTAVTSVASVDKSVEIMLFNASVGVKVGNGAGWLVGTADDESLVTLPASKTDAHLILPLDIQANRKIKGFYLLGQIESAGNTVTLDCELKKHSPGVADITTVSVGTMTQISVTADTIINKSDSLVEGITDIPNEEDTYFVVISGTTGASTDIALMAVAIVLEK